jgi:hypothetical protein
MSGPKSNGIDADLLAALAEVGLAKEYLKRLVIKHTLAQEVLDPESHQKALDRYKKVNHINKQADLDNHLKTYRLSVQAMEDLATTNLRIVNFAQANFAGHAQAAFANRRQEMSRILFSLCTVKQKGLASELFMRIESGEAHFSIIAEKFAEGPERQTKGVLGPLPITKVNQALVKKLLDAGPGQLIGPLRDGDTWLIARLESYYPAEYDDPLATQLCQQKFMEEVDLKAQAILENPSQSFVL